MFLYWCILVVTFEFRTHLVLVYKFILVLLVFRRKNTLCSQCITLCIILRIIQSIYMYSHEITAPKFEFELQLISLTALNSLTGTMSLWQCIMSYLKPQGMLMSINNLRICIILCANWCVNISALTITICDGIFSECSWFLYFPQHLVLLNCFTCYSCKCDSLSLSS